MLFQFPSAGANVDHKCPICLDAMVNPRTIKCGHIFCEECLRRALGIINICPICKEPQGIVTGNQPPGQMTWSLLPSSLPGYFGKSYFITAAWTLEVPVSCAVMSKSKVLTRLNHFRCTDKKL